MVYVRDRRDDNMKFYIKHVLCITSLNLFTRYLDVVTELKHGNLEGR